MKRTTIISLLIGCIAFGTMTTSCEDMLSPDSERHSYSVAQDTLYSYWGIIKSLQNVAERYIILGECRGELVSGTSYISDTITSILDFRMDEAVDGSNRFLRASDYYHIINSCNAYLANCDKERKTGTLQPYILREAAQVEAIRAWVYLQLVQVYGKVPFYTEPLLTTDAINNFTQTYQQQNQIATIDNLAQLLAPSLEEALVIEDQFGLPHYENYRNVCHSTKLMIPLNIILGDLYLTCGKTEADFEKAAQHYYNYLSNNQGQGNMTPGGALPASYCYGYKGDGQERPTYLYTPEDASDASNSRGPWAQTGAVARDMEAITAIPSSTNKLWGSVLRGVNTLYGFESEISVRTEASSDTTTSTSASIDLNAKYDVKQLTASTPYFDLCKAQNFELYIATDATTAASTDSVTIDPEVGDARQYWVRDLSQTYPNGLRNTEKFITKINPLSSFGEKPNFSTVAHMIYRKSMIWLRFAEAINRAGYPSYAFAILKNGLCNNDDWYPEAEPRTVGSDYMVDYTVIDTAWVFFMVKPDQLPITATHPQAVPDSLLLPGDIHIEGKPQLTPIRDYIYNLGKQNVLTSAKPTRAELEDYLDGLVADGTLTQDEVDNGLKLWVPLSFGNCPDINCRQALYYLNRKEVLRAPSFLNFEFSSLNGNFPVEMGFWRSSLTDDYIYLLGVTLPGDKNITYGIHSKGCGLLRYNDRSSTYNYMDKVAEKAKNYGYTLSDRQEAEDFIYNGGHDDIVQKCVEDLIVDEEALELAFEGSRFFDLLRVAYRRGELRYIVDKLALRNPELSSRLTSWDALYFPLPTR